MAYPDTPLSMQPRETTSPPSLPFSIFAINRSRFDVKVRIKHSLPQDVPQSFLDKYQPRILAAKTREYRPIYDSWKLNTYLRKKDGLLGLFDRTVLLVDIRPSTYTSWYETGKTDMNPALRDIVRHTGTSVNLLTSDDMLMFQFRSERNYSYTRWFGSGASGSIDTGVIEDPQQEADWSRRGVHLTRINKHIFKDTALREFEEETGHSLHNHHPKNKLFDRILDPLEIRQGRRKLRLLGTMQTLQKPINEFAYIAESNRTSEQLVTKQDKAIKKFGDTEANPMDRIGFIEASSEAVEKLLTQVQSPFIPTGLGTMLLTGRYLAFKESLARQKGMFGKRGRANADAEAWYKRVYYDAAVHYAELDQIAREYNIQYNQALPEGAKKRLEGLDPWFTPEEQGLLPMEEALQQAGMHYRRDGKVFGERQYTSEKARRLRR